MTPTFIDPATSGKESLNLPPNLKSGFSNFHTPLIVMTLENFNKWFFIASVMAASTFLITPTESEAICVKDKKANLRQGPGTHYEKLWQVFKYMPFKKLAKRGKWYRVQDVDGDIYWIFGKLVSSKYKCAVIKNNKTNLRKGPGTKFRKVSWSPVDKYFSMKVLATKNNWVHVEDGAGDRAWVYAPLVWIQ